MSNLGFGFMRLPMEANENQDEKRVDHKQVSRMVDTFLEKGFNYFDTAHGYIDGKSETAIRECLTSRYPRERYILADKLSSPYFQKEEDILPFFRKQLELVGVEYFDYYLLHSLTKSNYKKFTACGAFKIVNKLKADGKIRHIAISFHDKAAVLDKILSDHPEIEAVQIQFNYFDYDDPVIESGAVYGVCRKHDKPVIIMEPVKGGGLANLPNEASGILADLRGGSNASYALRYAGGFEGVMMVLSGMSTFEQLEENVQIMSDFSPLSVNEHDALAKVRDILKKQKTIACTNCRYCVKGCPSKILIPDVLSCINSWRIYNDFNSNYQYIVQSENGAKASTCIKCGECEEICPQHLTIRKLLEEAVSLFEHE